MSQRDACVRLNVVCLQQCLQWLFAGIDWSSITFREDCRWTPKTLVASALLWAWSGEHTLGERFRTVRKIAMCLAGGQQQLAKTYQAFIKMLRRWTDELLPLLKVASGSSSDSVSLPMFCRCECMHGKDRDNQKQTSTVSRCPNCGGTFCRECVTDEEGKMACPPCLRKLACPPAPT